MEVHRVTSVTSAPTANTCSKKHFYFSTCSKTDLEMQNCFKRNQFFFKAVNGKVQAGAKSDVQGKMSRRLSSIFEN